MILVVALIGIGLYLLFKIYDIFGVWNLLLTGAVQLMIAIYFGQVIGSMKIQSNGVMFNPKEWPKLLS
jgi:hypothetical protein